MRIFNFAPLLLLAACGGDDGANRLAEAEAQAARSSAERGKIVCAVDGASNLAPVCEIERVSRSEGLTLTIRHPAGGFRRLLVMKDGRGVIAADGAETAVVTPVGDDLIDVTLGGDRYQLPATVKGAAKAEQ